VFDPGKLFQSDLIFVGKTRRMGSYPYPHILVEP